MYFLSHFSVQTSKKHVAAGTVGRRFYY